MPNGCPVGDRDDVARVGRQLRQERVVAVGVHAPGSGRDVGYPQQGVGPL